MYGRYSNRLYAYEPADIKLCKSKAVLHVAVLIYQRILKKVSWFPQKY